LAVENGGKGNRSSYRNPWQTPFASLMLNIGGNL
jgi:hypothetical protein